MSREVCDYSLKGGCEDSSWCETGAFGRCKDYIPVQVESETLTNTQKSLKDEINNIFEVKYPL